MSWLFFQRFTLPLKLVTGETEVVPGIRVHWVGGHTAGLPG